MNKRAKTQFSLGKPIIPLSLNGGREKSACNREAHFSTARSIPIKNFSSSSRFALKSCTELRSTSETFGLLTDAYKSLMVKLPSDVISQKFPFLFDSLSTLYDSFSRTATSQLSMTRLKTKKEIKELNLKNTYFEKQAENLANGIREFMNITNSVNADGTNPHLKKLNEAISNLVSSLDKIQGAICGPRVTQDESMRKYQGLRSYVFQVKKVIDDTFEKPKSIRFDGFDFEHLKLLLSEVCTRTVSILSHGVPLSIKSPPIIASIRSQITSSCMNIRSLIESAMTFDESMSSIRSYVIELGSCLNKVFEECAVSVRIELKNGK